MAAHAGPDPATPPLVGRDHDQAALRAALAAALAGRGSLVLIGGEAGIGKTALAEWLLAEASAQGALVLVGRCYDLSETPPYGPWTEALERAPRADGVPAPPDLATGGGAASQPALFAAVRRWLAALAAHRPLVLLLEDLHWADPASRDLLRVLARQRGDLPLLLLATYRAEELADGHPLAALLPLLVREARAARLDLRPLDQAAIGALVAARYALAGTERDRLVRYLAGRTEGNALFLGELLRTLEGEETLRRDGGRWAVGDLEAVPVPPLLRQVIAGRAARLTPEAQRLLAVAAVIGQAVPLALWQAVTAAAEEALLDAADRAAEARLLAETAEGIRFAHALVREALYAGTAPLRRRALHRRAAEALLSSADPDPDTVASHLQRAGDPRAFAWLVRAGLRAHRAAAWLTAAERFAAAAALPDDAGTRARARGWLHFCRAQLLAHSDSAWSLRPLDEAEACALVVGDGVLATFVRFARGRVWCLGGDVRRGLAEMERQVAELEALPGEYHLRLGLDVGLALLGDGASGVPPPPLAPVGPTIVLDRGVLSNWLAFTGRYREALAVSGTFLAAIAGGDRPAQHASVQVGLAHIHAALGCPDAARLAFARGRAGNAANGNAHMVGVLFWLELLLVVIPYQADAVAERARLATAAARAWERAKGTTVATAYDNPADLPLALVEGRWVAANRLARSTSTAAFSAYAQGAAVALGVLARHQGLPDAAWARVRELHPDGPATEPGDGYFHHASVLQALAADLALDAGDLAAAGRWIEAHGRWLAWSDAVLWRADHARLRARLALASGDPLSARAHAEAALAHASAPRQPLALLAAHRDLGELDTAAGRRDDAGRHLRDALALADACEAPYERALTLLALAELFWTAGRVPEATPILAEARAICDRLGAAPALARVDRLAAKLALVRPAAYPDGLTAREVDVLRLVAAGHSNRAAATVLSVSRRTVERHLENAYRKIAARNRVDATAYALRHNLT